MEEVPGALPTEGFFLLRHQQAGHLLVDQVVIALTVERRVQVDQIDTLTRHGAHDGQVVAVEEAVGENIFESAETGRGLGGSW